MKIIIIGELFQQSKQMQYVLDNIQNCEIHFTNIEENLNEQIEKIEKNQRSTTTNIIYEIKKSNNQQQETVITQLKKAKRNYQFILLISNDQIKEDANKIKNQLNRYVNVQIYNLVNYFKQNYGFDKHVDLNGKQIALFISKEQDIKNLIFKTVKSPAILQNKWALINTPQFNMNQDVEERNEMISEFQQILKKYQNQISIMFIIVDLERNDIVKQNFMDLFTQFKKFKQKIIVLLYNRFDENFENNSTLNNFFFNLAKVRKVYSLSNNQIQSQEQINEYFNKILEEQQEDLEIGIDMKDTLFEIRDERQSEIDRQSFEQDFYKNKVKQLKQGIDQDEQQINLYQEKIAELQRSRKDKLNQIRELDREIYQKQKCIDSIQKDTSIQSQNSKEFKPPQQQGLQITNNNQVIVEIKNSQTIKLEIQNLERDKKQLNDQLQECYNKLENIHKSKNGRKSLDQERQLNQQIEDLWKKIEENDSKTREYNNQLEQLQQEIKKDYQKVEQPNHGYYGKQNNYPYQISKVYYDNYGSGWS
ncbi:unnamed protein product [Paramecium primaurelia]|uniref:Uncharacterized protein n=1 Tax=Paramecium primaurelia TaxID=5886 RepID=A0A8S1NWE8_PARPR|nr:unnamed protein product [Paramecium primaurelia]